MTKGASVSHIVCESCIVARFGSLAVALHSAMRIGENRAMQTESEVALRRPLWQRRAFRRSVRCAGLGVMLAWLGAIAAAIAFSWQPPVAALGAALLLALAAFGLVLWLNRKLERLIRDEPLPPVLQARLLAAQPKLGAAGVARIERGLRQFFLACYRSHPDDVAMPSVAAASVWHDCTQSAGYARWCERSVGHVVEYAPATTVLGCDAATNDALRRAWYWACSEEGIDPRRPTRLPTLFALDADLATSSGCEGRSGAGLACAAPRGRFVAANFTDPRFAGRSVDFGGAETST